MTFLVMVESSLVLNSPGRLPFHSDHLLHLILEFLGQGLTPEAALSPPIRAEERSLHSEGEGFL